MDTKSKEPLKLTSMGPLDDGGRKYNILYVIAIIIGIVTGFLMNPGIEGIIGASFLSIITAVAIKSCILDWKWKKLRKQKFVLDNKVPYEILIHNLVERLSPLNFQIERSVDGNPVVTRKKMIYDISYGEDNSFTIWWRKSVMGAMFDFRTPIHHYRNTVADMGIIAYNVQQVCCNNTDNV